MRYVILLVLAAAPAAIASAAPAATPAAAQTVRAGATASVEADRRDILAMAGDYKVRFDMQEATSWRAGYTPLPPKVSGGYESVRVIENSPRRIVLQHLLVVDIDGKSHIVKHWRQDWDYEPARILVYTGPDTWRYEPVSAADRKGRWSQTVWQVDDSPRYAGIGKWETIAGVRQWTSNRTLRPLPRRDAIRGPGYDRFLGVNRHAGTPTGWVHWQDNTKLGEVDGKMVPFVQEYVLNTYTKFDGYNVKAADEYWAATRGMWAAVRAEWDRIAATKGGIRLMEVGETGSAVSARLLQIADELQAGKITEAKAIAEAKALMQQGTTALK